MAAYGTIEWTPEALQFLRDNAGQMFANDIAKGLGTGHSRSAVIAKMKRLKLPIKAQGVQQHRHVRVRKIRPHRKPNQLKRWDAPQPKPPTPYVEPEMPVLQEGDPPLHSRQWGDLESGMCYWPVYLEQGVQMYCAAATERVPGRFATYCACHQSAAEQPRAERRTKYKQGIWAR